MKKVLKSHGFTLVELMIATGVFAVIMIISLYGFIQINRYYTKGITIARTQEAARNLVTDIGNQFQLTNGTYKNELTNPEESLPGGFNIICIGNKAYLYKINTLESNDEHAITSYEIPINTCPLPTNETALTYLLKPNARLLQLDVTPYPEATNGTGPLYNLTVALLYAPFDDGDINSAGTDLVDTYGDNNGSIANINKWQCRGNISGSEYCSLSRITTQVYKRMQ